MILNTVLLSLTFLVETNPTLQENHLHIAFMNEKKGKRMGWLYNVCILFSLIAAFSLDMTP